MLTVVCTHRAPHVSTRHACAWAGIREQQDTMPTVVCTHSVAIARAIRTPTIDESRVLAPALEHASACDIHVTNMVCTYKLVCTVITLQQ